MKIFILFLFFNSAYAQNKYHDVINKMIEDPEQCFFYHYFSPYRNIQNDKAFAIKNQSMMSKITEDDIIQSATKENIIQVIDKKY